MMGSVEDGNHLMISVLNGNVMKTGEESVDMWIFFWPVTAIFHTSFNCVALGVCCLSFQTDLLRHFSSNIFMSLKNENAEMLSRCKVATTKCARCTVEEPKAATKTGQKGPNKN